MSDDSLVQQDQPAVPAPIDNRRTNLMTGLDTLKTALAQIPHYEDNEINAWFQYRNTHWIPLLRQLDEFSRIAAELFPGCDLTTREGYPLLTSLIQGNLCDMVFQYKLAQTATNFVHRFEGVLAHIPDHRVSFKFMQAAKALDTASQQFTQDQGAAYRNNPN